MATKEIQKEQDGVATSKKPSNNSLPSPPLESQKQHNRKSSSKGSSISYLSSPPHSPPSSTSKRIHRKKRSSHELLNMDDAGLDFYGNGSKSPSTSVTALMENIHVNDTNTSLASTKKKLGKGKHRKNRSSQALSIGNSTLPHSGEKRLYCRVIPLEHESKSGIEGLNGVVLVNDDYNPVLINNENFTGHAVFRVKNFRGITPVDRLENVEKSIIPISEYFDGHRRTFSLQISGRFRRSWTADEVMFGTFFERPIHLPPFYQIAIAFAKKIDASMDGDLAAPQPYMCSPAICAMNIARAEKLVDEPSRAESCQADNKKPLYLPPWKYGGPAHLQENFMETIPEWAQAHKANTASGGTSRKSSFSAFFSRRGQHKSDDSEADETDENNNTDSDVMKSTPSQRRAWFLKPEHRANYTYQPDQLYSFDFNNQYVDLNTMTLKLGLTFDVAYYLNGQPVRYQMRSRDGNVIFFTIELGLI